MKHKHAEMIKAKADNMDLVVFGNEIGGEWRECDFSDLTIAIGFYDFFLCLPQNKEVCLHWLNGGELLCSLGYIKDKLIGQHATKEWSTRSIFMNSECEIRIKPKKVKYWIAIEKGKCNPFYYKEKEAAERVYPNADQYIQIEVEL